MAALPLMKTPHALFLGLLAMTSPHVYGTPADAGFTPKDPITVIRLVEDTPSEAFVQAALTQDGIVVVLCYFSGCAPSRDFILATFKPLIQKYTTERSVHFVAVQFANNRLIRNRQKRLFSQLYGMPIRSFPHLIFLKQKEKKLTLEGAPRQRTYAKLSANIAALLRSMAGEAKQASA